MQTEGDIHMYPAAVGKVQQSSLDLRITIGVQAWGPHSLKLYLAMDAEQLPEQLLQLQMFQDPSCPRDPQRHSAWQWALELKCLRSHDAIL